MHKLFCLLMLTAAVSAAQVEVPTFTSEANVVLVPALVRNQDRNPVYGLSADDFIVEDNGHPQTARMDENLESEPISLLVAIQVGRRAKREFGRIRDLGTMLEPILKQPQTEAALLVFDHNLDLAEDFTQDQSEIVASLKNLQPGDNGAAILDAVQYGVRLLNKRPEGRQRVLLLISETRDHGSRFAKIDDVVTLIGDSGATVYSLAFSPSVSNVLDTARGTNRDEMRPTADVLAVVALAAQAMRRNTAKAVADQTGGEYELFETSKGFESHIIDFTNHLHSRYLLSFAPKDPQPGLHRLQVRMKEPAKGSVLARISYWAGK
jgi:VWFA-related protein